MEFSLTILSKYFENSGNPVQITIDLDSRPEPRLGFLRGPDMNGSLKVFLDFRDISDILEINNITGENALLQKELADAKKNHKYHGLDKRVDDLVYETIRKYVCQMYNAAIAKIIYPEIIPLEKHKRDYFRDL